MAEVTRDMIIEAAKRIAASANTPLTKTDFVRLSGIGEYHIYRLLPEGGWSEVKELAGLERHPMDLDPVTDEQLIAEFYRVAKELGKIPNAHWKYWNYAAPSLRLKLSLCDGSSDRADLCRSLVRLSNYSAGPP